MRPIPRLDATDATSVALAMEMMVALGLKLEPTKAKKLDEGLEKTVAWFRDYYKV